MKDCYQIIQDRYDTFPKQQKKIADFILTNISEVIYYPLSRIADEINVSKASIVRFAKNLGYKGFPEFRENLFSNYKEIFSPGNRVRTLFDEFSGEDINYKSITEQEIYYLMKSVNTVDDNSFLGAVDLICNADTVHVMGIGPNEMLGRHLYFRLNRFGVNVKHHKYGGIHLLEDLAILKSSDIAIAYNFFRISDDQKMFINVMKKENIPVILITDILTPAIIKDCRHVLFAERGPHGAFHSPLVPMAISNALLIGVAKKLDAEAFRTLDKLEKYRQEFYFNYREEENNEA